MSLETEGSALVGYILFVIVLFTGAEGAVGAAPGTTQDVVIGGRVVAAGGDDVTVDGGWMELEKRTENIRTDPSTFSVMNAARQNKGRKLGPK